jgi:hypothetical protein
MWHFNNVIHRINPLKLGDYSVYPEIVFPAHREQRVIISSHSILRLVLIIQVEFIYCATRPEFFLHISVPS